jgi:alkanesulfonate monooxygenase SsuD/methylene tetrahydromethanopterin reductase-like flavin-dependent oxidoreductase (luciferase family)
LTELDLAFWDSLGAYHMSQGARTADVYDYHIDRAQRLEELGFHSYWVIEHQNSPVGEITSPSVYLTGVAMRTSTLRVGAMIWQIPFHNPMRLAEEVAMLDHLSHGRVEFGSGIGVHEHEFMRWGLDYYQRAPMSLEAMEIIMKAWTEPEVTYQGKYWTFDEALPAPKPYQEPHPPVWIAAHSKPSMEYAAKNNWNVAQNLDTDQVVAENFDHFRKTWREFNHPGPMPRIFLQRAVFVAETDALAREQAEQYVMTMRDANTTGRGKINNTRIGWGSNQRGMGRDSERPHDAERARVFQEMSKSFDFTLDSGLAIVGSPDTVIRKLEQGRKDIGYDVLCGNFEIGAMPRDMVTKSIELFGKEVIPAFNRVPVPA